MGLQFRVGPVEFVSPFQEQVEAALLTEFGYVAPARNSESAASDEIAWSGLAALQEAATEMLGSENAPHLLSTEAWLGVYLPLRIEPRAVQVGNPPTMLACAGLFALHNELTHFAAARSLPMEEKILGRLVGGVHG